MSEQFSVGEMAEWFGTDSQVWLECVILQGPAVLTYRAPDGSTKEDYGYYLECPEAPPKSRCRLGPQVRFSVPERLRKKKLPPIRQELGEWDLCPWRPKEVTTGGTDEICRLTSDSVKDQ